MHCHSNAEEMCIRDSYYSVRDRVPPRVTLDGEVEDSELLQEWLSDKLGKKVTITIPKIGEQAQLVEMCRNNAAEKLAQSMERTGREASALDELGRLLGMDTPPMYIDCLLYTSDHSLDREVGYLTAHSVLHLLGYDHERGGIDRVRMREKEEQVMTQLGLPSSSSYVLEEDED